MIKLLVKLILLIAPFGIGYWTWISYGQTVGIVCFIIAGFIAYFLYKRIPDYI